MPPGTFRIRHSYIDKVFNLFYRPQTKLRTRLCFYTVSVILFTGGGSAPLHAWIHTTPPGSRHPPGSRPPGTVHARRNGQYAGGTHPTGMQSCLNWTFMHSPKDVYYCDSNQEWGTRPYTGLSLLEV